MHFHKNLKLAWSTPLALYKPFSSHILIILQDIIDSYSEGTILEMRRQGRVFYETYMFTKDRIVDSVVTIVRHRLQMSAPPKDVSLETIHFSSEKYSKVCCYWISYLHSLSINIYAFTLYLRNFCPEPRVCTRHVHGMNPI